MKSFYTLDLFRIVASFGVAISHYYFYLYDIKIFEFLSIIFVEFFFILSGFLLAPQIIKAYNKLDSIKIFFYRRWLRTLPCFYLALITYSISYQIINIDTLKYFFFIGNIVPSFLDQEYFVISWSLSIEEWFYIIFPIYLFIFKKFKFLKLVIYFILIINIAKIFFYLLTEIDQFRIITLFRLDAISLGCLLYLIKNKINKFLLINFLSSLFMGYLSYYLIFNTNDVFSKFIFIWVVQIFSINIFIIFFSFEKFGVSKILKLILEKLSKITYTVYLFHFAFIIISKYYMVKTGLTSIYLYLITMTIFCTLIYNLFEKQFLKIRPKYD